MKIQLKPISHPAMNSIAIDDNRITIGRIMECFGSLKDETVAQLSRKHARIFRDGAELYIVDLGSLNGTLVNDQPVEEETHRLLNGDQISLAGVFSFRVEMEAEPIDGRTPDIQPPPQLKLVPQDTSCGIDPIPVTHFPFLITRGYTLFGQYMEESMEDVRKISRPHAIIGLKDNEIYIEDLESANGTFVSGEQLDAWQQQVVPEATTIAFGGDRFTYRVKVQQPEPRVCIEEPEPTVYNTTSTMDDITKELVDDTDYTETISITSNLLFLDDDYAENGDKNSAGSHSDQQKASVQDADVEAASWKRKIGSLFTRRRQAQKNGSGDNRKIFSAWVALYVLAFVMIATPNILVSDRHTIKKSLDSGAYSESAVAANQYLKDHPDDDEVNGWAMEAFIKAVVPAWIEHAGQGRFDDAETYLTKVKKSHPYIDNVHEMTNLLIWIGWVENHFLERGETARSIDLFQHEEQIRKLVEEWNRNSFNHQLLFNRMVDYVPAFEKHQASIIRELKILRSDNALYGQAISELKGKILQAVENGDHQHFERVITNFAREYPKIRGLDAVRTDAEKFELLASRIEQNAYTEAHRQSREIEFRTPLVRDGVKEWLAQVLPPGKVITQYNQATKAWGLGQRDKAIEILKSLQAGPWSRIAKQQVVRYNKILAAYIELQKKKKSEGYNEQLLTFHAMLRPSEDEFFIDAIQSDFQRLKNKMQVDLKASFKRIQQQWSAFQDAGGIPGVVLIEGRVSKRFRRQAERLSEAYSDITENTRRYDLIKIEKPAGWHRLKEEIESESRRQYRWLKDLDEILEPDLIAAKLDLLPEVKE